MLWSRFRTLEHWSDAFFTFITAYFPVDYVLVHDAGIPPPARAALKARLLSGTDGWHEAFNSTGVVIYTIDRSFGRGPQVDRLWLRRHLAPQANVAFSARAAFATGPTIATGSQDPPSTTLELLLDGGFVERWTLDGEWRDVRVTVPVETVGPDDSEGWPRTTTLLRWRVREGAGDTFEIRNLRVERHPEPRD
jgi:hypothetical protein